MIMRKYIVNVDEDGHVTALEYEEPKTFVYSAGEGEVVRDAYNQALRDVKTVLDYEKARCEVNSHIIKYGEGWVASWSARSIQCGLIKTAVDKLFR